jgi:hypothetical protein
MLSARIAVGALALIALSAPGAQAQSTLSGTYDFRTVEKKNGVPVCSERWTFGADGVLTVESGQELAHDTYRLEHDKVGDWIITKMRDTNGKPDCTGQTRTTISQDENRTYWFAMNDGTINVCPPPAGTPPFIAGCYAWLTRPPEK